MLQGYLRQHFEVFPQPSRPVAQSGTAVAHWRGDGEHETGLMSWSVDATMRFSLHKGSLAKRRGVDSYLAKIHWKNFR